MFGRLFLLFTLVPAIEIYLLFKVGSMFGALNTVLLIIITGIVGASFARSQGFEILMKIQKGTAEGGLPANHIIHGVMILIGGVLLITPGILTDVVGLSFVAPGPRHLLFVWFKNMIMKGLKNGNINFQSFGSAGGGFAYSSKTYSSTDFGHMNDRMSDYTANEPAKPIDGDVFEAEFTKKD